MHTAGTWVVYVVVRNGASVGCRVCPGQEWERDFADKPDQCRLVQAGLPNESTAEQLARETKCVDGRVDGRSRPRDARPPMSPKKVGLSVQQRA
jgi:hypothetical protein